MQYFAPGEPPQYATAGMTHIPSAPTPRPPRSSCASHAAARSQTIAELDSLAAKALTQARRKVSVTSSTPRDYGNRKH